MKDNTWQLQEAKSKFSQLIDRAIHKAPQIVTRHGNKAVVVLSYEEYSKITKQKGDLVTFLKESPLTEVEIDTVRNKDVPREIEL